MSFKHFFLILSMLGVLVFGSVKASASTEKLSDLKKVTLNNSSFAKINYWQMVNIDGKKYLIEYDEDGKIVSIIEIDE